MSYEISVEHSIDTGHRIVGHGKGSGKCARLHGHTYGVRVTLRGLKLDELGFVVDFGEVKDVLNEWDHRMLLWDEDPFFQELGGVVPDVMVTYGLVNVPFNPTAENMARHLAERLLGLRPWLVRARVVLRETPTTEAVWDAS